MVDDNLNMKVLVTALVATAMFCGACTRREQRGIADKRTNFERFLPMTANPAHYGLKPVRPFFRVANRMQILRAIERACHNGQSGSSVQDSRGGYYVNCNPENRQLLNGYIPSNAQKQPHSRGNSQ